ncbi:MAG: choice-of-anchor J domain-containing protein, partial [Bacteroidales bacterium]|nr:choice-of-anchor J domain-containing protein [Bacteroidales bacterium]
TISYFNNMLQLDSVDGTRQIVKQASEKYIEPEVVTINDIKAGGHQARLVKLENVQFLESELGQTWADGINLLSVNRTLQDCENNIIIVRTSGYADFANDLLPEGNGSFIGIVGQFGDVWQLYVRDPQELGMSDERCEIEPYGTFDNPYTVEFAYQNNAGTDLWVQGYIIGVMETSVDPFAPSFTAPFNTNSNIIIADSPDETSMNNALIVQLPFGSTPRAALNLVDNPQRLGVFVKLKGNLAAYFGVPGMRDTSDYWLEDDDDPDDPDLPDPVTFIDEDFQSYPDHDIIDDNGWTAYAEAGSRYWICRTFQDNHYAQATAFNSADASNIMWMITPPIDLDAMTNPTFEFESAKAFYTHDGFSLHISTNFDGVNVTDADWQTLDATLAGQSDGDNAWIHSGFIDLSSFSGIVHIAWRYEAAAPQGQTGTFRVDNVKLYEGD